jgi:hypothetical protein
MPTHPHRQGRTDESLSASRPSRVPYLYRSARRPVAGLQGSRDVWSSPDRRMLARAGAWSLGWRSREAAAGPLSGRARDANAAPPPPHPNQRPGEVWRSYALEPARRRARRGHRRRRRLVLRGLWDPRRGGSHEHLHGVATAGYARSLASAHRRMRRALVRRAGGEADVGTPSAQPIRWQRSRSPGRSSSRSRSER